MDDLKPLDDSGAIPVVFCTEKKKWLPIERHMDCENCAAAVFDENDDPVSFVCTKRGERLQMPAEEDRDAEIGRGAPLDPDENQ